MSQAYERVYNFSAGPSVLPVSVLEQARDEMLNYRGTGMSVMEMSHRSKPFETILGEAVADLRTLLGIPDNYRVLFLQGGASMQFTMVPTAFLAEGQTADFVLTGSWGKKAVEAARLVGKTSVLFDGKADNFRTVPKAADLKPSEGAAYLHLTTNETIQGVEFAEDLDLGIDVVADMSSDILSRPVDISKYALIYAGAQKNMGPAGATLVIVRDDFLARSREGLAPMLDYRVHVENDSMYNTPPCWSIYICGLVYKHLLAKGGLPAVQAQSKSKAGLLYAAIDASAGFYKGHADADARSTMNVTFTLPTEELTTAFLKGAPARKLDGLKGHRSVGGCRASIYNAFPEEGCQELAAYMADFAAANG